MIRVRFDPANLAGEDRIWWEKWEKRAEKARRKCLKAHRERVPYKFVDAVWHDLKVFLFKTAFNKKCGYCESTTSATQYGDADHYRPKGRVRVCVTDHTPGTPVKCNDLQEVTCNGERHPGYYWLAYDWRNLVPACQLCNQDAKIDQFPVKNKHCCSPDLGIDDLDREERPHLLNPHFDPGKQFLVFGERGQVSPRDDNERGKHTIAVCLLAREDLETERGMEQKDGFMRYMEAIRCRIPGEGDRVIEEFRTRRYTQAVKQYVEWAWKRYVEQNSPNLPDE